MASVPTPIPFSSKRSYEHTHTLNINKVTHNTPHSFTFFAHS
jgi:hypothetical protein